MRLRRRALVLALPIAAAVATPAFGPVGTVRPISLVETAIAPSAHAPADPIMAHTSLPSGESSEASHGLASTAQATGMTSPTSDDASIKTTEVSFTVQNVNRSKLACPSDGGTYHVVGTLVTPAQVPKSVTLWIHNSIGNRNTFLVPIRNYHFANEMAKLGHAGLFIDQLGYGKSDRPENGHLVCPGSEATAMYQVMEHLRSGDYAGDAHPSFEKVAVGGFSIGAWQAELIGVSFPKVDGIIPIGGMSAFVSSEAPPDVVNSMSRECATGSYFHFASAERRNYWAIYEPNVDKDVEDWWATNAYGNEPCGIWEYIMASTATVDAVGATANPDLKVLVVLGDKDRILPPPNGHFQVARFFNCHDVSLITMPNTGHAVMLERNAPMFRQQLHLWMVQRGL